jgi:hypothetical protein
VTRVVAVGKYSTELRQIKGIVGWVPFSGDGALQWVSSLQADVFFTTAYTPNDGYGIGHFGASPSLLCFRALRNPNAGSRAVSLSGG